MTTRYFDSIPHRLDWSTMTYRWFGVVWKGNKDSIQVLGCRFEDSQQSLDLWLHENRWIHVHRVQGIAQRIYQRLRSDQQSRDWMYHKEMPRSTLYKRPWNRVNQGWYVFCSREKYPFVVSAVERTSNSLWMHHQYICECEVDLNTFVERVNQEWSVTLQKLSTM